MPLFPTGTNPFANLLGNQSNEGPYSRSDQLMGLSLGLISGKTAADQLGMGLSSLMNMRMENRASNRTVALLKAQAPELAEAIEAGVLPANDAFKLWYGSKTKSEKPLSFQTLPDGTYGSFDSSSGTFNRLGSAAKPAAQFRQLSPDEIKARGLDPSKAYQVGSDQRVYPIGGDGITINNDAGGPGKPPSGFRWSDPNDPQSSLAPIAGGPATQLPAETAGRVGLADNFLSQFPDIKKSVDAGDVTGWVDRGLAGNNSSSPQANTYRQIQSGVDALTRMLTGAGQNEQEARAYAERYLPTYTDDAKSASAKLDQLALELKSASSTVLQGRQAPAPTRPTTVRRFNPATGRIE